MNNLAKRTVFGALYLVVLVGGLLAGSAGFAFLGAFVIITMMEELFHMSMGRSLMACRIAAVVSGLSVFGLLFAYAGFGMDSRYLALCIVPVLAMMVMAVVCRRDAGMDVFAILFAGLCYAAAPVALCNLFVFKGGSYSALVLLGFFVVIWASDIGAYCIGTMFGQKPGSRKLCPSISPKKSWVGYWGGLAFALLAAALLSGSRILPFGMVHCLVLGLVIHVFGVFGDLFESLWKRRYGFKDSGNLIPGHGGMLDRLDSSLFAIPAAACYLEVMNLI